MPAVKLNASSCSSITPQGTYRVPSTRSTWHEGVERVEVALEFMLILPGNFFVVDDTMGAKSAIVRARAVKYFTGP